MIWLVFAIAICAVRVCGITHEAFQAIAHFYVAWMIAAWWYLRQITNIESQVHPSYVHVSDNARWYGRIAIFMSVVETICASVKILMGLAVIALVR